MTTLLIGSMDADAGKTSLIAGLGAALERPFAYLKPFGDRLFYHQKRLWDHDAGVLSAVFELPGEAAGLSIGHEHSRLRLHDEATIRGRLSALVAQARAEGEVVLVEGARDLRHGCSVHLDILSLARGLDGTLVMVIAGDDDSVLDSASFTKRFLDLEGIELGGLVVNKVHDIAAFRESWLPELEALGTRVLGVLPYRRELTHLHLRYLSERLQAKVLAGWDGLEGVVKAVFVGAMSATEAQRRPQFSTERKVIITSGDRSDMIVAAVESGSAAVVLTNDVVPPARICALADEHRVPLLQIEGDTFSVTKRIDDMVPLLHQDDAERLALLGELVREHVDLEALLEL